MYCPKCGNYVPKWSDVCLACGFEVKKTSEEAGDTEWASYSHEKVPEKEADDVKQGEYHYEYGEQKTHSGNIDNDAREHDTYKEEYTVTTREKLLSILSYIGPLFIVSLLLDSNSKFIKFHSNQGLLVFLLGIIGSLVGVIGDLIVFCLMIYGIKNALMGKKKKLPLIGEIQIIG